MSILQLSITCNCFLLNTTPIKSWIYTYTLFSETHGTFPKIDPLAEIIQSVFSEYNRMKSVKIKETEKFFEKIQLIVYAKNETEN